MCKYGVAATSADESPRSICVKGHVSPIGIGFVSSECGGLFISPVDHSWKRKTEHVLFGGRSLGLYGVLVCELKLWQVAFDVFGI